MVKMKNKDKRVTKHLLKCDLKRKMRKHKHWEIIKRSYCTWEFYVRFTGVGPHLLIIPTNAITQIAI